MKPYSAPDIRLSAKLRFPIADDRIEWLFNGWERRSSVILYDYCGVPLAVVEKHCEPPFSWGDMLTVLSLFLGISND